MQEEVELSIIMPCLNEAETLAICIRKATEFIKGNNIKGEVVIGDNGSTDGSQQIAIKEGARVIAIPEKGYGAALMGAIKESRGKYIIMGDSDDSYDFSNLMPFVEKLRNGYDLVMGNRFKGGIKEGAMPFLHRYLGNPVLSFIGKIFFNIPVNDFHCGLRGFNKQSILSINLMTSGMEFASEMVVKSALFKLKIAEVSTVLSPDGRTRAPHLRTWRDGWRHLRFLLMFSPRWLFLYPGVFILLISSLLFCRLLISPLHIGRVVLGIHSMVYFMAAITLSFQIVLFYLMSKIYAINQGLVPVKRSFNNIFRYFTLERGLIFGGLLISIGVIMLAWLFIKWQNLNYGPIIDIDQTLKLSFISILSLVIGVQAIFSSFMLSILGIIQKLQINSDDIS
jgi:glycosyltransferase involved in cell wall biosynthesis